MHGPVGAKVLFLPFGSSLLNHFPPVILSGMLIREKAAVGLTAMLSGLLAVLGLRWWFGSVPPQELVMRRPLEDPRAEMARAAPEVSIAGDFAEFGVDPPALPGSWPRFRGPDFDNICRSPVRLVDKWGEDGPEKLWSVELGEGYAGPAVRNGRVYVLDYDEDKRADMLRCFSLADGREVWRRWYSVQVKRNHGMSRTVPAVTDRYVVSIGPKCHVLCADAVSGEYLWGIDLVKEYGSAVPLWYTGQCPLIENDVAVIAPGGKALMVGISCADGAVLWQTPNPDGWQMSHSSIMPLQSGDVRMYVYCAIGGIVAVYADGPQRGEIAWKTTAWNHAVVAPSPVFMPEGRIFVTAGYGVGSKMLQMVNVEGEMEVRENFALTREQFACEQQTPIFYDGHLFSVLPKDGGALKSQFVCMTGEGEMVWNSGKTERFGLGPFLASDGKFFIMSDDGVLTMVRADTARYDKLAEYKVLDGRDAWGPMAMVNGLLLCRDSKRMVCLDLRAADAGGN